MQFEFELVPFKPCEQTVKGLLKLDQENIYLRFQVENNISKIQIPKLDDSFLKQRSVGLWEKSCFELFIKNPITEHYLEFNFSPTGQWNCFEFFENRGELKEYLKMELTNIDVESNVVVYQITLTLPFSKLPKDLKESSQWQVGVSAVLLDNDNETYLYALHHKAAADFHDPENYKLIQVDNADL